MTTQARPSFMPATARTRLPSGANSAVQPGPRSSYQTQLTPRINSSRAVQQANAGAAGAPRPYTYTPKSVAPYGNVASNPGTATVNRAAQLGQQVPRPPDPTAPRLTPRPPRGPVATWNAAAKAGGNATSAAAAAINNSLTGISPAQAVSALGLAGIASGSITNAQTTAQNQAITYSGSIPANYATAYGAKIPFGTGPSTGSNLPGISTPTGAAPGAGAVATGAAAAGAGLAALSGWIDGGQVAGAKSPQMGESEFGTLTYHSISRDYTRYNRTKTVHRDYVINSYVSQAHCWVVDGGSRYTWYLAEWSTGSERLFCNHTSDNPIVQVVGWEADEVESEDLTTRPEPSESLKNPPSTRDTSNPPRTPAPARTTTLRRTPTAPSAPPLTLPSPQPIPPGILPVGDPLNPPAPVENPTAPSIDPPPADQTNVPAPTPTTPPSTTPQPMPRPTETPTGTTVIDTPTGAAEVQIPPGGLVEPPTGATITTAKDLPKIDSDWIIPPLLIGGGLAIGTAIATGLRVDDPTTPGKFTQAPPTPTPPKIDTPTDNPCKCNGPLLNAINGSNAATQAQLTRIEANQNNPLSGFAALQAGQAGIFGFLQTIQSFAETAWRATKIQKLLDVMTFLAVAHNVSMLSRDVAETMGYVISQGLDIVGIDDEEGNPLDINSLVTGTVEDFFRSVLGDAYYEGLRETYQKANRIVQSASMIVWTVRSITDTTLDLTEWIAEHTGKIGNALKRFGVVGERAYPWMSERAQAQHRMRARFSKLTGSLENAEDVASSLSVATSNVLEIQQETSELGENFNNFRMSVTDAIPDPWADNTPVATQTTTENTVSQSPDVTASDADRGAAP